MGFLYPGASPHVKRFFSGIKPFSARERLRSKDILPRRTQERAMMRPRHFFLYILLALLAGLATAPVWAAEAGGARQTREIVDQNLFHPSRREALPPPPPPVQKPTPPPAPPPPPPPPPPKFALYGVVIFGSEPPLALLKEPQLTQDKLQAYPLGTAFGHYRLSQIEGDRVVLTKGEESLIVLLHDPSRPKTPPPPTSAAPPPPQAGKATSEPVRDEMTPEQIEQKRQSTQRVIDLFKGVLGRGGLPAPGAPLGQ